MTYIVSSYNIIIINSNTFSTIDQIIYHTAAYINRGQVYIINHGRAVVRPNWGINQDGNPIKRVSFIIFHSRYIMIYLPNIETLHIPTVSFVSFT